MSPEHILFPCRSAMLSSEQQAVCNRRQRAEPGACKGPCSNGGVKRADTGGSGGCLHQSCAWGRRAARECYCLLPGSAAGNLKGMAD